MRIYFKRRLTVHPQEPRLNCPQASYKGNIVISKPLTLLGKTSDVVIYGEGNDTVITVNSSHVVLKNLQISHSGRQDGKS